MPHPSGIGFETCEAAGMAAVAYRVGIIEWRIRRPYSPRRWASERMNAAYTAGYAGRPPPFWVRQGVSRIVALTVDLR